MDGDVQQQYLAAEQAYGEGDFDQAEAIASALLRRLDSTTGSGVEQEACLAWRAFVALLLGHIYFHGLHQADKAEAHYQLVLASTPPDTLRDLAQQGVERCKALADQAASSDPPTGDSSTPVDGASIGRAATSTTAASNGPDNDPKVDSVPTLEHDLIRDPFLGTCCATTASSGTTAFSATTAAASTSAPTAQGSATPWLQNVTPLQNEENDMTSVADASALAVEPLVIAASDAEDDDGANDVDRLPLTAASGDGDGDGDGDTLRNNAKLEPDVEQEDVNAIAADEAPPPIDEQPMDELPPNQTPTAVEPLDLSLWLLRRTISFNKR